MQKTKNEFALRVDGKFNVWRKVDIIPRDGTAPHYGDWIIRKVVVTRDEALKALRD